MSLETRGIEELGPWFHNLHLPDGRQTAPDHWLGDFPQNKWVLLAPHLPESLERWTVLDVGCNAGFYCFELARRGAEVVGIEPDEHYLEQARWARHVFELDDRVELRRQSVYDLARSDEEYDLVVFMGVLYHLRHPLLALDAVVARTRRLLVLQTLTTEWDHPVPPVHARDVGYLERELLMQPGWPTMAFVERRLFGDPTNWWVPNHGCVEAMARSAGLELVERPANELWLYRPTRMPRAVREELEEAATPPA